MTNNSNQILSNALTLQHNFKSGLADEQSTRNALAMTLYPATIQSWSSLMDLHMTVKNTKLTIGIIQQTSKNLLKQGFSQKEINKIALDVADIWINGKEFAKLYHEMYSKGMIEEGPKKCCGHEFVVEIGQVRQITEHQNA